jgi:hypothetical protein
MAYKKDFLEKKRVPEEFAVKLADDINAGFKNIFKNSRRGKKRRLIAAV